MAENTEIKIVIDGKLEEDVADQIAKAVKESWKFRVGEAIAEAVIKKLSEEEYTNRVAEKVAQEVTINEEDFTVYVTAQLKATMLQAVDALAVATLKKVTEKVKEYGFIKIGDRC
jgi:3-oxoacyl-[acyl-carrier-protein] synthase III